MDTIENAKLTVEEDDTIEVENITFSEEMRHIKIVRDGDTITGMYIEIPIPDNNVIRRGPSAEK